MESLVNKRIAYQGQLATVKYEGPIKHENKGEEIWLGVEWDEPERGRHNGTVQGYTYFTTSTGANSGSLLRKEKVTLGHKMIEALFLKYFKEIPPELIKDIDLPQDELIPVQQQEQNVPQDKVITLINQKQVKIEFDKAGYIETIKKKKKMIEFYGFDEIYKKMNNLETLQELSLENQLISQIGPYGYIASVFKNLKSLGLEGNLLYSWHQVFVLTNQLTSLKELSISGNLLQKLETFNHPQKDNELITWSQDYKIYDYEQNKHLGIPVDQCSKTLEILVLISMKLSWKDISQILPAFPGLQELLVCKNQLTDYQNLVYRDTDLRNLRILNLESTELSEFQQVENSFGELPKLERLILNRNYLKALPKITKFNSLKHLAIDHNLLLLPHFLSKLINLNLTSLSIKHNPLVEKYGKLYVRQRSIAEIACLQVLNGSEISKFERKDSEIFYLKSAFEEYFLLKNVKHYYYDYDDFIKYAEENHPKVIELIKKFGNPYEIDPTVKGSFTQPKVQVQQPQYCTIKIIDMVGKLQGKPTPKKLMGSTGLQPVKMMISKLVNISVKQISLSIQVSEDSEIIVMDGKDMTLNDFGVQEGSLIYVNLIPE